MDAVVKILKVILANRLLYINDSRGMTMYMLVLVTAAALRVCRMRCKESLEKDV